MLKVEVIPALEDNYIFLIHSDETGETAMVDTPDSKPAYEKLNEKGWNLTHIFNTHHHWDHVDCNEEIKRKTGCRIIGFEDDASRIPGIDTRIIDGQIFEWGGTEVKVIHVPGHTTGIITYYFEQENMAFVGDTLLAMGCGFLFEGTPEQAYNSLIKLKALPDDTKIYCAHEHTLRNAEFCLTIEPDNKDIQDRYEEVKEMRGRGEITIPTNIGLEKKTNSFLRVENAERFAEIRELKNHF